MLGKPANANIIMVLMMMKLKLVGMEILAALALLCGMVGVLAVDVDDNPSNDDATTIDV